MHEPFSPEPTVRLGKYVLPRDMPAALRQTSRPPRKRLPVELLLTAERAAVHRIPVSPEQTLPESRFDYIGADPRYHGGRLPATIFPPTSVVVIDGGRVVGRTGTVHVPAADACIVDFEWPCDDLGWFRRQLPGGAAHPRYWKQLLLREVRRRVLPAVRRCPGRVAVLNGASPNNFYHWMGEILPRLMTLRQSGAAADWYVVDAWAAYQREALAALGVSAAQVIQPHGLLHLEADTLLVPSIRPMQELQATAAALAPVGGAGQPIVSRRLFIDRRGSRRVANAAGLDAALETLGFGRWFLEDLSLHRQVELFRAADIVLGLHGAGFTNIMHCRPGTLVVEVVPEGIVRPCYPNLSRIFGLRHVLLTAPRRGWHQDVHVPIAMLAAIIPPP
jgi:hypothetical protein